MERDWRRLGRALAHARDAVGKTQVDVANEIGVSRTPIQAIERGTSKRITSTIRAYAKLVGWTDGSVEKVLAGSDPKLVPDPNDPEGAADESDADVLAALPVSVAKALTDGGKVLEATVFNLRRPGGGRAIFVVKGQPDASPEEIAADLEALARREIAKLGIAIPDDNGDDAAAQA